MPKYIRFDKVSTDPHAGKERYVVTNIKSDQPLADVFWYPAWRQWVCRMNDDAVWSEDCLRDVREFVLKLNAETNAR